MCFLLGALDDNGNAIISIPDSSKFNKASDQDREKLFNYLVSLARWVVWARKVDKFPSEVSVIFYHLASIIIIRKTFWSTTRNKLLARGHHIVHFLWIDYFCIIFFSAPIEKQGFVIVLDRRKAKWNNVKTALLQIEVYLKAFSAFGIMSADCLHLQWCICR